jgi:hypothetical protein
LEVLLQAAGDDPVEIVDPATKRRYVLVDSVVHRQAMAALQAQDDRAAIAR